jgi:hypothetical protein
MTDVNPPSLESPHLFNFDWIPAVLFSPRRAFVKIAAQSGGVWFTSMLLLTVTAVSLVIVTGWVKGKTPSTSQSGLSPEAGYYTPEQQTQLQQAQEATRGPVFVYVLPALLTIIGVWVGWLLVGGMLHLALTLLGGRGSTGAAMNVVAWAALPLAIRDIVRIVYILATRKFIANPGISGFAPLDPHGLTLYLTKFMALIDIYIVWHVALIVMGVRAGNGLSRGKAVSGVVVTVLIVLSLQALLGYLLSGVGSMTITKPFFF